MTEILNLNRARKAKARAAKSTQAEANRSSFGRTRTEKAADALAARRSARMLDGAKRD